jgi:hypothetical protein
LSDGGFPKSGLNGKGFAAVMRFSAGKSLAKIAAAGGEVGLFLFLVRLRAMSGTLFHLTEKGSARKRKMKSLQGLDDLEGLAPLEFLPGSQEFLLVRHRPLQDHFFDAPGGFTMDDAQGEQAHDQFRIAINGVETRA